MSRRQLRAHRELRRLIREADALLRRLRKSRRAERKVSR